MFKRLASATCVAALFAVAPLGTARASQICTTGSLAVCVDFTLAHVTGQTYTLTVHYASTNDGGVLTDFGIDGPTAAGFTASSVDLSSRFSVGSNCSLQDDACASANAPPVGNGLLLGQTAVLTFTAASGFNGDFSSSFENAHLQSFTNLPNCSVKIGTPGSKFDSPGAGGVGTFNADASDCALSTTSTPEPASLVFLATGLVGFGGIGGVVRRRRRSIAD